MKIQCHCQNNDLYIRQPQYKDLEGNKLQMALAQLNEKLEILGRDRS